MNAEVQAIGHRETRAYGTERWANYRGYMRTLNPNF